mmetsp:Transcript_10060/g.34251  ORF Transcript_10060/g.34251 Transcript_10060/m.34251 type:complete len:130 (+) Transcript_10060:617-1006(+)
MAQVSAPIRVLSGVFAAVFVLAASVQTNDPDALTWIAIYMAAASSAALAAVGHVNLAWSGISTLAYSVLFAYYCPALLTAKARAFQTWKMQAPEDEVAREAIGLLLCAFSSAVLLVAAATAKPKTRKSD